VGRTTAVDSSAEAGSFDYLYDGAGRLTQVTRPDLKTVGYGYDAAGNRTRKENGDSIPFLEPAQRTRQHPMPQRKWDTVPVVERLYTRSSTTAMPWPTPMQAVQRA
jgi:YD repeat-containing protein